MSFSQIIIVGHLGADPELKYTKTQTPVINLSVGSHERLRPTDPKDKKPKTYWHKCRKFGKLAETYKSMLKKGDKVFPFHASPNLGRFGRALEKSSFRNIFAAGVLDVGAILQNSMTLFYKSRKHAEKLVFDLKNRC